MHWAENIIKKKKHEINQIYKKTQQNWNNSPTSNLTKFFQIFWEVSIIPTKTSKKKKKKIQKTYT